jgi:two-component system, OmpR family, KDP operon response regulator KdpE
MKILLVEDDIGTVESIKFCLEIYKPEATLVATDRGLEAVEKLKTEAFDCVLIDLGLPDIDGLEILRRVREFSQVPAIVVSARHQKEAVSKAKELGVSQYITKPFDHRFLIESLNSIKTT